MSSVQIITDDLKRQIYRLEGLAAATPQQRRRLLERSIIAVERAAKRTAPVGKKLGGTLRSKIGWKIEDDGAAVITAGVVYGRIQEFGGKTKAHRIEPKNGKALAFVSANHANTLRVQIGAKTKLGYLYHGLTVRSGKPEWRAGFSSGSLAKLAAKGLATGMVVVKGVNHPGSKIKPKHYTRDAFETTRPQIEEDAKRMVKNRLEGKQWP